MRTEVGHIAKLAFVMLRWRTVLLLLLFLFIGDAATNTNQSFSLELILLMIAVGCWYINATSTNDITDYRIDLINLKGKKDRPLVSKSASILQLKVISLSVALICLTCLFIVKPVLVVLGLVILLLNLAYSFPPLRISYRGLLAPLLLPIGYVVFPVVIGMLSNTDNLDIQNYLLIAALYIGFIGRIILKDYRDVKGDKAFGKRTFLIRSGSRRTCLTSATAWLISNALITSVFWGNPILIIVVQVTTVTIWYLLYKLSKNEVLTKQLGIIGAIGRIGNGLLFAVLVFVSNSTIKESPFVINSLVIAIIIFFTFTAYNDLRVRA